MWTCWPTDYYSIRWSFANSISTRICLTAACRPAYILADTEKAGHMVSVWNVSKLRPLAGVLELSMCCHAMPLTRSRLFATTILGTGNCKSTTATMTVTNGQKSAGVSVCVCVCVCVTCVCSCAWCTRCARRWRRHGCRQLIHWHRLFWDNYSFQFQSQPNHGVLGLVVHQVLMIVC